ARMSNAPPASLPAPPACRPPLLPPMGSHRGWWPCWPHRRPRPRSARCWTGRMDRAHPLWPDAFPLFRPGWRREGAAGAVSHHNLKRPAMKHALGLLAALMISTAAHAHGVTEGDIEIIHPNIPQPAAGAKTAGGYMGISNEGAEADRLIAVETDAA